MKKLWHFLLPLLISLPCSASAPYQVFEPYHPPMNVLSSHEAVTDTGIVLWGPYQRFAAGDYTVFFTLRSPEGEQTISAEIYHHGSNFIFAEKSHTITSSEWQVVPLDFTLDETDNDKDLEFRLWKLTAALPLHLSSILVVPKHPLHAAGKLLLDPAFALETPAWVQLQLASLAAPEASEVFKAFTQLTTISRFDFDVNLYEYFHSCTTLNLLLVAATNLLQDKSLQLTTEHREEILQHWVSLRTQVLACGVSAPLPSLPPTPPPTPPRRSKAKKVRQRAKKSRAL